MESTIAWLKSREGRKWLYTVALALVALAAAYGLLDPDKVPLWLSAIAAILGVAAPAVALRNLSPDPVDPNEPEDSISIPEDLDGTDLDIEGES